MLVPLRGLTARRVTPALMADVALGARQPVSSPWGRRLLQQVLNLTKDRTAPEFCRSRAVEPRAASSPNLINDHYRIRRQR